MRAAEPEKQPVFPMMQALGLLSAAHGPVRGLSNMSFQPRSRWRPRCGCGGGPQPCQGFPTGWGDPA